MKVKIMTAGAVSDFIFFTRLLAWKPNLEKKIDLFKQILS